MLSTKEVSKTMIINENNAQNKSKTVNSIEKNVETKSQKNEDEDDEIPMVEVFTDEHSSTSESLSNHEHLMKVLNYKNEVVLEFSLNYLVPLHRSVIVNSDLPNFF